MRWIVNGCRVLIAGLLVLSASHAAAALIVKPLTWNVIGLDSNRPADGPRFFPVGARVCSSVATSNVTVNFVWDSANVNINWRPGSLSTISIPSLAAGACSDAYFEVAVTTTAAAFDTVRRYHITATDFTGTASTPTPRELYVEHLISQNRNAITGVKLDGASIPAGGTMTLLVGNTYSIELTGGTATQGYEQFEAFINFPNTVFQVLAVNTTYSANTSPFVTNPNDKLYADACGWENAPSSPNYRACLADGKTGGQTVVTTYTVKIISGGGTSQTLNTLLYDFSGSSYHYNSDFSTGARIASIVDPAAAAFGKAFAPSTTVPGGTSTLTFTLSNPTSAALSGASFTDPLPLLSGGQMVVATPATFSTSGCGAATFAPVAGASSISFSNGTIAAASSCVVTVAVSVPALPATGTYVNTSNNLFFGAFNTGKTATANLTVASATAGTGFCGLTFARWNFPNGMSTTSPAATTSIVATATLAGAGTVPDFSSANNTIAPAGTGSWASDGSITVGATLVTANNEYFEFAINTTGVLSLALTFDALFKTPNGPAGIAVYYGTTNTRPETGTSVYSSAAAISGPTTWTPINGINVNSGLNPSGLTYFRIYAFNSGNDNPGSDINLDNVLFTGCSMPAQPTLTKAFAPATVAVNGISTLTLTLTNPNTSALTGAKFNDSLPAGLEVAPTPNASTTCGGSPTWAPVAAATTLAFGQATGATIPASGSCTVTVSVRANTAGPHSNVSGFLSTTEAGTNSGPTGSAKASLRALTPPTIAKAFSTDPILAGGTTLLTFTITNPNSDDSLTAVAFNDPYPAGLTNVNPLTPAVTNTCNGTVAAIAGGTSLSLTNGSVAGGASCTIGVTVTAAAVNTYANASLAVSAAIVGAGNTASDSLLVVAPNPSLTLRKEIGSSPLGPWLRFISVAPGTGVYYRFTVENTGDVPFSPVSVNDPLVSTASCAWPATLPVASPLNDPTATCVVGPVNALAGDHPNTATAQGTFAGNVYASTPSSADYLGAVPGFSLLKQVGTSATGPWSSSISVTGGSSVFYKLTLVNTGDVPLSAANVTDAQVNTAGCAFSDPLAIGSASTCVVGPVTASNTPGIYVNTATGHGTNGGTIDTAPSSAQFQVAGTLDLRITKSHTGNFTQGQVGAQYALAVSNIGSGDKSAGNVVTVTEAAPAGLTLTAMSGFGWTCTTLPTCTRTDILAAGNVYPGIVVTVDVALNASSSLTNSASVGVAGQSDVDLTNNTATDPTTIVQLPDLTLVKSHSGSFIQGQTGAQYTLLVTNSGAGAKSLGNTVTVTESAPSGLTVTAMSGTSWTCTTLPTCTRSDVLTAGSSYDPITVTVDVAINAPSSLTNVATVALAAQSEMSTANNSASDPTAIGALPDLTIAKSHAGTFIQGQIGAQYSVTVTNNGAGAKAAGNVVTVTETVPAGMTLTAMSGTGWTCTTLPICARSDALAAAASYEAITVTVDVALNAGSSLTNVVTVSLTGQSETSTGNNSASDSTAIGLLPDLTIAKTHGGNFLQGQVGAQYSIIASNIGTGDKVAGNIVTVTESAPSGLTVTAMSGSGWTCTTLPTCTRSDVLAAGASYAAILVTVNVAINAPSSLTNVASVALAGQAETSTANNGASDPTTIGALPDLAIAKTHSGSFTQGQAGAQYTITVSNVGAGDKSAGNTVTVTDSAPTGMTLTAMSGNGWTCTTLPTCTRADGLAAGTAYPAITATVTVALNAASPLTNGATVALAGQPETTTANNTANDATTIVRLPDLVVAKTHTGNFTQGQTGASYTITVTNSGTGDKNAGNTVTVTDTVPSGMTLTAMSGSGWTCTTLPTCTRSDILVAGASYPAITATVSIASNATSPLSNSVSVALTGQAETSILNNGATDPTTISALADLAIAKTHSGNFTQGQTGAQYTITVSNVGNGDKAAGNTVTVTDTVPAGMTLTAMSGPGWTCTTLPSCTRSDLLAAGSAYPAITATVDVALNAASPLTNSAAVTLVGQTEASTANNTAADPTAINQLADLAIAKTHSGNFTQGQNGAQYSIIVSNVGTGDKVAGNPVTVTETVPNGMTLTAMSGGGWTCATLPTCTRSDVLAAGAAYPAITATVNVALNAASSLVNSVSAVLSGQTESSTANNTATDPTSIGALPDLAIAKTHSGNFTQGQVGAQYALAISNIGTGDKTAGNTVTVADTAPAGLTITAMSGSGWTCTTLPTCTRNDLLAAGNVYPGIVVTVNVALNAGASLTNTVTVALAGQTETGTANNSASDPTTIVQLPDLVVAKSHSGNFTQGQTGASYTITVSNSGAGDKAAGNTVTVTDTVPSGMTLTAMSGSGWTCTTLPICTRSDVLTAGSNYPAITATVNVALSANSPLVNSVTVALAGQTEVSTANNTAIDPTTISALADLAIAKSHSGSFTQGQTGAQYTITVSNIGNGDKAAGNTVTVTETVPAGMTLTAMGGTGWSCTTLPTCTRNDILAPSASYPGITATINVALNAASPLVNSATVALTGQTEASTSNNTATDPTTIAALANLAIAKTHAGNFTQGQTGAQYTITVTNSGSGDKSAGNVVTVTETVPTGMTLTAMTGIGWTCTTLPTCTRSDVLAAGASYPAITAIVNIALNAASSLANTVNVALAGQTETSTVDNAATDPTTIGALPDLAIAKTHSGNFTQGQLGAQYALTISNVGTGDKSAGNVVTVTDTAPAGMTVSAMSGTGWTCTTLPTCSRNDVLAAGSVYPGIIVTVNVALNAGASLTNTATVALAGQTETSTANNSVGDPTTIVQLADLTIVKTHGGNFTQGQNGAQYTITVTNSGSGDKTAGNAVAVTESVPTGMTLTAMTGTGWICTTLPTCTRTDVLAAGASYPTITATINVAMNATSTLTNVAAVALSGQSETSTSNNSASDPTTISALADLSITKSHAGSFTLGQIGAQFTIVVSNVGNGDKLGGNVVTVSDAVPSGMTLTAMSGNGWTCATLPSCSRSDALAVGASYPPITVTVNIAVNAPAALTNIASVALTGQPEASTANNTTSDAVTIGSLADLTITKTHAGTLTLGQVGATFTLTVSNIGNGDKAAGNVVSVGEIIPAGMTLTAMSGTGWICATLPTCTRSDALAAGAAYPALIATVDIAANAASPTTNTAMVALSGQAEASLANNSATDTVSFTAASVPDLTITKAHTGTLVLGQTTMLYTIVVTNSGNGDKSAGNVVSVTDDAGAGMVVIAMSGSGWNCASLPICTRSDVLPAGSSYPGVIVSVLFTAGLQTLTNSANVALTGQVESNVNNNAATDVTALVAGPDMTIAKFHTGLFAQGQAGARYSIIVSNVGAGEKSAGNVVTVTDTAPAGMVITGMSGGGWTCTTLPTCTRPDVLASGNSWPTITVTVTVDNTAHGVLINTATVALTGQMETDLTNNAASDPTVVVVNRPIPTLSFYGLLLAIGLMLIAGWIALRKGGARQALGGRPRGR